MRNAYEDADRAAAYASLGFPGTYHLAFRDLPPLLAANVSGRRALDFGCGAGRSTRFLRDLGFDVVGVDVSREMLARARSLDGEGRYEWIAGDEGLDRYPAASYDLVLAAYPFDNIPGRDRRARLMGRIARLLASDGRFVLIASAPELYRHEWLTFSTAGFPENATASSGDPVRIVIKEGGDHRPVDDLLWEDHDYQESFRRAGLRPLAAHRPLGRDDEPFAWVNETRVAPWVIYVTGREYPDV